jgi:hypothetical protein
MIEANCVNLIKFQRIPKKECSVTIKNKHAADFVAALKFQKLAIIFERNVSFATKSPTTQAHLYSSSAVNFIDSRSTAKVRIENYTQKLSSK